MGPESTTLRGGYYPAGNRYELHQATMADLIRTAWTLDDNNRVPGGPAWLDDIRFDVLAKAPESTQADTAKIMLRRLLADRMELAVHEDRRPLPAYVLTAGTRAPRLKATVESGAGAGQCQPQSRPAEPGTVRAQTISCHGITMEGFSRALPGMAKEYFGHYSMADLTGLKGSWDYTLTWNTRSQVADAGSDSVSLFDAVEKQLGLQLRLQDIPLPVIVVDRIHDKPIESTPETLRRLPHTPTEFEVGAIKPSPPGEKSYERVLPSGEVDLSVQTLKELILYTGDIAGMEGSNSELLDAPGGPTAHNST